MKEVTDLNKVKEVAKRLLNVEVSESSSSPLVVSHPFTYTGVILLTDASKKSKYVDITKGTEGLQEWRNIISQKIDKANSVYEIYTLINVPYLLTFIKLTKNYLSVEDLSKILGSGWPRLEFVGQDPNVTAKEIIKMFKDSDPELLMDSDEISVMKRFDKTVTIYRGIDLKDEKSVHGLSWTIDKDVAKKYASRFGRKGDVYRAKIDKSHILAYLDLDGMAEVVVDPRFIKNIELVDDDELENE